MPQKKNAKTRKPKQFTLEKIWSVILTVFKTIGSILSKLLEVLFVFFSMLFEVLKTFFFGISSVIAATALMIIAVSLTGWFLSSAIGLPESETFQSERDKVIEELFQLWEEERQTERQFAMAREENLRIEEISDLTCQRDTQCQTPVEYLTRSSCPFESRCIENECVVVCPLP